MRKLISIALFLFLTVHVLAQDTSATTPVPSSAPAPAATPAPASSPSKEIPSLHFGMKVQPALAWFKTDDDGFESNGSEFRFSFGFVTEFRFAERYSFATGIDVV